LKPETKKLAIHLLINSILLVVLYFSVAKIFPYIWVIYLAAGAGIGFYYVIYNKGFSGKGVTPDMLDGIAEGTFLLRGGYKPDLTTAEIRKILEQAL
jgi:hypothetical protein